MNTIESIFEYKGVKHIMITKHNESGDLVCYVCENALLPEKEYSIIKQNEDGKEIRHYSVHKSCGLYNPIV